RQVFGIAGALLGGAKLLRGQKTAGIGAVAAIPPADELVNAFEFEEQAKLLLPTDVYAAIAGSDREAFNRMTFRPRMCSPTMDMNLDVPMFGETLFTPIIVGPISDQRRFHAEGEVATVRGAGRSYAPVVVSGHSSVPFSQI